nr:hypothetical protein [Oceanobacillus iheyensis]
MSNENTTKLEKWRAKYGALAIALSCLCTMISIWESNWFLTGFLGLGVFVCGSIGIFDIKRSMAEKH